MTRPTVPLQPERYACCDNFSDTCWRTGECNACTAASQVPPSSQSRRAALLSVLAICAAPAALAFDVHKFGLLTMGISRAAAIEILGHPDSERCTTTLGVTFCRLEWRPLALLSAQAVYRADFLSGRLMSKSTCQPSQQRRSKERP